MSQYHAHRRAVGENRHVPYRRADGLNLPLRGPRRQHNSKMRYDEYAADDAGRPPPLPPAKDVVSRSKRSNRDAAAALRNLLDSDEPLVSLAPMTFATGSNAVPSSSTPSSRPGTFLPSHPYNQRGSNSFGRPAPHNRPDASPKSFGQYRQYDRHRRGLHTLQHIGGGDQEAEWRAQNHHLLIGQDGADHQAEDAPCDIPMPRTASAALPNVRLNPDLPPLSAEHPARVWNSMLHALAPELQPIVRWEYDNVKLGEEWAYVARVTIILPPSHPAIACHPVAKALPKDKYAREYAEAMSVLGGVKTFVGPARKLKADAQNTTITMSIAENALAWVHAPIMAPIEDPVRKTEIKMPAVDLGVELINGTTASVEIEHELDLGVYGCRLVVGREPHFQHYVEDIVHPTPQAAQQAVCQRAVELNVRGFLVWLQGMELGNDGHILEHDGQINIAEGELLLEDENDRPATELEETEENRVEVAEDAPGFESGGQQGARMDGGTGGGEEMACDEDGTAGEGHTAAAEDSRTNDNGVQNDTGIPSEAVDEAKSRPASTPIKREVDELEIWTPRIVPEEVDWQSQLAYFCHLSALPPPSYSQTIIRRQGHPTLFLGKVVIEGETYESADGHETIRDARQSVAQKVFTDMFGQEPAAVMDMPPEFRP